VKARELTPMTFRLPKDLAAWLKEQGNQAAVLRRALEAYRKGGGNPEEDRSTARSAPGVGDRRMAASISAEKRAYVRESQVPMDPIFMEKLRRQGLLPEGVKHE
jgi:hypothetical protein